MFSTTFLMLTHTYEVISLPLTTKFSLHFVIHTNWTKVVNIIILNLSKGVLMFNLAVSISIRSTMIKLYNLQRPYQS